MSRIRYIVRITTEQAGLQDLLAQAFAPVRLGPRISLSSGLHRYASAPLRRLSFARIGAQRPAPRPLCRRSVRSRNLLSP
jgi:hypothetical protein